MGHARTFVLAVFALVPLLAQEKPKDATTVRQPKFTLVAGEHDVKDLVLLLAQIRKTQIDCPDAVLPRAEHRRLFLQHELRLDADAFDDVATALLYGRKLMIVTGENGNATVVALGAQPVAELLPQAVERTPQEILARPWRTEFVRTKYTPQDNPVLVVNLLRPMVSMARGENRMVLEAAGDQVTLAGRSCQVVAALRFVMLFEGRALPVNEPIVWAADSKTALPKEPMPLADFTNLLARVVGANIVLPAELPEVQVVLEVAGELAPAQWFAEATRALAHHSMTLVLLHGPGRVFQLVPTSTPTDTDFLWRSEVITAEQARDPLLPIRPVMVRLPLQHVELSAVLGGLRPLLAGSSTSISSVQGGLITIGMSEGVRLIADRVAELDVPKAGGDPGK